jgi:transcriptional regulator GlxA family with amidase domain
MDFNFWRPSPMKGFAGLYGASPRRLQRDFHQLTGCTIQAYVTKRRIEAAMELLRNTDSKVESIAAEVGWASRKNLNRALARHHLQSPINMRRKHLESTHRSS